LLMLTAIIFVAIQFFAFGRLNLSIWTPWWMLAWKNNISDKEYYVGHWRHIKTQVLLLFPFKFIIGIYRIVLVNLRNRLHLFPFDLLLCWFWLLNRCNQCRQVPTTKPTTVVVICGIIPSEGSPTSIWPQLLPFLWS
jgi:hypothetical protein